MGNALIGRMLASLLDRDGDILVSTRVTDLRVTAPCRWRRS